MHVRDHQTVQALAVFSQSVEGEVSGIVVHAITRQNKSPATFGDHHGRWLGCWTCSVILILAVLALSTGHHMGSTLIR
jgi:hypothetical protein